MKHVTSITADINPQKALALIPVVQPIKVDQHTAQIVNTVFEKLQGIFPAWRQAWTDDTALSNAKREWIAGFIQGGINSDQQLAFGFQQARKSTSPFLPNVGQFVDWCKPTAELMGMPSTADAWIEALQGKYTHDGVRVAAEATGTFDLRQAKQTDKPLFQRFERNYAIVIRRAQTGQSLEGRIATGIGHDSKTPYQAHLAHSHQESRDLITAQGLPTDPKVCRALLLAKFKIRQVAEKSSLEGKL